MKIKRWINILVLILIPLFLARADISEKLQKQISANFKNTSLTDVLRILASQNNLNLVIGEGVNGKVTVQLNKVSLADALSTILKSRGCHYLVQNNILLVKSFENNVNGELESSIMKLKYLDGFQLQTTLSPLLSGKGKIEPLISENEKEALKRRSDVLIVTDLWENVEKIQKVIQEMDQEPVQIKIEVKLIETLLGNESKVGLNLPTRISAKVTGAELSAPISKSTGNQQQQRYLAGWYQIPEIGGGISLGVLTVDELNATLEALAQTNKSRLVSNPHLTTLNNKKAVIEIGTSLPIPEVSRGLGGDLITYKEKQVSMYLEVIPRINEDDIITLIVHPRMEEIIGYTGPSDYPQPITSKREVTTQVTVRQGETAAIGGLIKASQKKTVQKVWLLGDIPLLGYLFRHTVTRKEKTDMLIFITPTILKKK